ncbi:MAG TPA: hypothetical protein VL981_10145 [Candidatus Methylacidiphilales bacterium]|nr:hypothetical protein [Candidatus Methylacidiphilales bacterium]
MKKLLIRSPQNCAVLFTWFEGLFLFGFIGVPISLFVFHWFFYIQLASEILFICVCGLLVYQIEYHPLIAIAWIGAFYIPYANLIALVVLFFQVKAYLRKKNYRIGLWGARPIPPEIGEIAL